MMNRQTSIAYIDLLTVLVALFAVVTGVLLSQNRQLAKGNVTEKAEFLAVLEWPNGSKSDVDLWVRSPNGEVINFGTRDRGVVTLDHDDMGIVNNTMIGADGKQITNEVRREMVSFRSIMPGRHLVNVMLFALREPPPVKARVQIIKLNPYRLLLEREMVLRQSGEEQTVASFDVASDGAVAQVDTAAQVRLAEVVR